MRQAYNDRMEREGVERDEDEEQMDNAEPKQEDLTERYRLELAEARARISKLEKYIIDKLLNDEL